MTDLELASTDEIIEELSRRYRNVAIVFEGEKQGNPEQDHVRFRWAGHEMSIIGLLVWSKDYLLKRQG